MLIHPHSIHSHHTYNVVDRIIVIRKLIQITNMWCLNGSYIHIPEARENRSLMTKGSFLCTWSPGKRITDDEWSLYIWGPEKPITDDEMVLVDLKPRKTHYWWRNCHVPKPENESLSWRNGILAYTRFLIEPFRHAVLPVSITSNCPGQRVSCITLTTVQAKGSLV
jgi:hypothetical protein